MSGRSRVTTHVLDAVSGRPVAVSGAAGFYPEVAVTFNLDDPAAHYHVPLLLSPYAFSTYRGSWREELLR